MKQTKIREKKRYRVGFSRSVREHGYYYVEATTEAGARKLIENGDYDDEDVNDRDIGDEDIGDDIEEDD